MTYFFDHSGDETLFVQSSVEQSKVKSKCRSVSFTRKKILIGLSEHSAISQQRADGTERHELEQGWVNISRHTLWVRGPQHGPAV